MLGVRFESRSRKPKFEAPEAPEKIVFFKLQKRFFIVKKSDFLRVWVGVKMDVFFVSCILAWNLEPGFEREM